MVLYHLLAVDSLSRKIRAQPLKSKTALAANLDSERTTTFETLQFAIKMWVASGKEFNKFCGENEIEVFHTLTETETCMAEKYIRTFKTLLYKYFGEYQTFRYNPQLQKFVSPVNKRRNRSIGKAANDVNAKHFFHLVSLQKPACETGTKPSTKLAITFAMPSTKCPFEKVTKNSIQSLQIITSMGTKRKWASDIQSFGKVNHFEQVQHPELTHFNYLQDSARYQTVSFSTKRK